jgi:hypothetical protein
LCRFYEVRFFFLLQKTNMSTLGFASIASGVSSGGALAQLVCIGNCDSSLTAKPEVTFWKLKVDRCSNFALESVCQAFNGNCMYGGEQQLTLNRTGDLVYKQYLVAELPAIEAGADDEGCRYIHAPTGSEDKTVNWVNEVGHVLIRRMSFAIGGQQIDAIYPAYMHAYEELTGKTGKKLGEMIGKYASRDECIAKSATPQRLYIPLIFYYNGASGRALPLVSLQFHSVTYHISFESLYNLIQVSHKVKVINKDTGSDMTNSDLNAYLDTQYVYLDLDERDRFNNQEFSQLVHQTQTWACMNHDSSSFIRANLNFNHPTVELIWMVQDDAAKAKGDHFDFSIDGADPLSVAKLSINSLPRFQREAAWFRTVQPYQHHTNIPSGKIYTYSFALHPESEQPSASLNFSRVDTSELLLELAPEAAGKKLTLMVFARSWNVLRFKKGLAGIVYSN